MTIREEPPEFTGQKLWNLVCEIERAVGGHMAGRTPLGRAVIELCERAVNSDTEIQEILTARRAALTSAVPRGPND